MAPYVTRQEAASVKDRSLPTIDRMRREGLVEWRKTPNGKGKSIEIWVTQEEYDDYLARSHDEPHDQSMNTHDRAHDQSAEIAALRAELKSKDQLIEFYQEQHMQSETRFQELMRAHNGLITDVANRVKALPEPPPPPSPARERVGFMGWLKGIGRRERL